MRRSAPNSALCHKCFKAGANQETLLQKQNCIQEATTVFQNIFCYYAKHRFFVFNICKMQAKKRKHIRNNEAYKK